jgi:hypothetical protein
MLKFVNVIIQKKILVITLFLQNFLFLYVFYHQASYRHNFLLLL